MKSELSAILIDAPTEVPGLPGIFVRPISQASWEEWAKSAKADDPPAEVYADLVIRSVCDASGSLLFTETPAELCKLLNRKKLRALFKAAFDANRLDDEAVDSEKKDSAPTTQTAS